MGFVMDLGILLDPARVVCGPITNFSFTYQSVILWGMEGRKLNYKWPKALLVVFLAISLGRALETRAWAQAPPGVGSLVDQAGAAFAAGDYGKALRFLEQAYKTYPNPNILWNIGRCYEEMHEYKDALKVFKMYSGMRISPREKEQAENKVKSMESLWAAQLEDQADKLLGKGDRKGAIQALTRAYRLGKNSMDLLGIAKILESQQKLERALEVLLVFKERVEGTDVGTVADEEIATVKLKLQEKRMVKAGELVKQGKYGAAIQVMESAFKLRQDLSVLWEIAGTYEKAGKKGKALQAYKKILSMSPGTRLEGLARQKIKELSKPKEHPVTRKTRVAPPRMVEYPRATHGGQGLKVASYIVAGVAGALAVTGGVLAGIADRDFNRLEGAATDKQGWITGMSQEEAASLQSSAWTKRKASWILFGSAGGIAVVSLVLYFTGLSQEHISVGVTPGGAGLSFSQGF